MALVALALGAAAILYGGANEGPVDPWTTAVPDAFPPLAELTPPAAEQPVAHRTASADRVVPPSERPPPSVPIPVIVCAEGGQRAAGAELSFHPTEPWHWIELEDHAGIAMPSEEPLAHATADSDGQASLLLSAGDQGIVVARRGSQTAICSARVSNSDAMTSRPLVLSLGEARIVSLLVLGDNGLPAPGIVTALLDVLTPGDPTGVIPSPWQVPGHLPHGVTDRNGRVTYFFPAISPSAHVESLTAFVLRPGGDAIRRVISFPHEGGDVLIRLPPCSDLEIELLNAGGRRIEGSATLAFHNGAGPFPEADLALCYSRPLSVAHWSDSGVEHWLQGWTVGIDEGRTVIAGCVPGATVRCEVRACGYAPVQAVITIPDAPHGPPVTINLTEPLVQLSIRIEDEQGVPRFLPNRWTPILRKAGGTSERPLRVLRSRGRVDLWVVAGVDGHIDLCDIDLPAMEVESWVGDLAWVVDTLSKAQFHLPSTTPGQSVELGRLSLPVPPLCLAGHVVGPSGEGLRGAIVSVKRHRRPGETVPKKVPLPYSYTTTDDDGHFRIGGPSEPGDVFELEASTGKLLGFLDHVRLGTESSRIVCQPAGSILGRIVGIPPHLMSNIRIEAEDARHREHSVSLDPHGEFLVTGLAPGLVTLTIETYGLGLSFELPRVEAQVGLTLRPATLSAISLADRLSIIHVRSVDGSGRGVPRTRIEVSEPDWLKGASEQCWTGADGHGSFLWPHNRPMNILTKHQEFLEQMHRFATAPSAPVTMTMTAK